MMLGGITDAILLVALGLGYIVCHLAKREEKTMQAAGYLIGTFIILLSGILIVSNLLLAARFCGKMGKPGRMMQQKMMKGQMSPMPAMPMQQPSEPKK